MKKIKAFVQLGKLMVSLGNNESWKDYSLGVNEIEYNELEILINKQFVLNGWFTKENVRTSLKALGELLTEEQLVNWVNNYHFNFTKEF